MKKIIFTLFSFTILAASAQDASVKDLKNEASKTIAKDPKDTVNLKWKKGGNFGINLNQGTLSNWSAGGDKFSLSINSLLSLFCILQRGQKIMGQLTGPCLWYCKNHQPR